MFPYNPEKLCILSYVNLKLGEINKHRLSHYSYNKNIHKKFNVLLSKIFYPFF